jgi:DUF4097 and DUF4098 domain-containing protein YvlB
MRRSSLVGPIILIGIGVLFLLRNLNPQLPVLDFLAQYWPFLLIAWGVLRLVEILFWAASSKPLPQNGVTGGEWVLIILLCLIGSGMYAARNSTWFSPGRIRIGGIEMFGEAYDYPLTAQKQVGKVSRVVVESFRGNARIVGAETEEIKITGRKTIRSMDQGDADRTNQDTPLEIVVNGDRAVIRTNQDRVSHRTSRISEDLEITIPKGASLEAVGRYGDFDVSNLTGNVEIVSDNAGVRIDNIGGNVRVDTRRSDIVRAVNVKGSAELKGAGTDVELENIEGPVIVTATYGGTLQFRNLPKRIRFESRNTEFTAEGIPGQVRISLTDLSGSRIVGPVRLHARTKDVQMSDFSDSLDLNVERGDIELRPARKELSRMEVRTNSGDIDLAVPEGASLTLAATTDRGEITNDLGSSLEAQSEGRGATLKGSIGDGPRVVLATNRGSITVRRAVIGEMTRTLPEAPEPPRAPKPMETLRPVEQ